MIGFMPTKAEGAIGSLEYTSEERKTLARRSLSYCCPVCGLVKNLLLDQKPDASPSSTVDKDRELAKQITIQPKKKAETNNNDTSKEDESKTPSSATTESTPPAPETDTSSATPADDTDQGVQPAPPAAVPSPRRRRRQQQHVDDASSRLLMAVLIMAIAVLFVRRLEKHLDLTALF